MLNISDKKIGDLLDEDQFYSLRTLKTPGIGRQLAKVLLVIIGILFFSLFLPWQQNIRATGNLTALNPENRPQDIHTAIAGRITSWKIIEGQFVKKGDTILSLTEIKDKYFDPNLIDRMDEQIAAKQSGLEAKQNKQDALLNQIQALEDAKRAKLAQARNKIDQLRLKVQSDSVSFLTEQVQVDNTRNIFERNKARYEAGNIPLTKFQELESKYQQAAAKVVSAENKWLNTKTELINAQVDLARIRAEFEDKISKARSDLSATSSDVFDTQGSLSKMQNEYTNVSIRQQQYKITAPQSGHIVRALKAGIGETIKEGEAVATIVPALDDKAAEMFIKAMDLAFIDVGRKVRVEFDGWPALQFSGWPNASVGTFGGIVRVIDRIQTKPGMFRILVVPDPEQEPWPARLRMGSGVKGWVMLDDVPIWYEIWRQMNGFPPSIYEDEQAKKEDKPKSKPLKIK